jgi:hypothetical protein
MKYALMFKVSKDGEISPVKWSKDVFLPDQSIILLEEQTPAVWLWHGENQSLIDRRIANRQAEALKGYGYKAGDTIIGSRTRIIKEIDQRKIDRETEAIKLNEEFQGLLNKEISQLDEFIVIFKEGEVATGKIELKPKTTLKEPSPVKTKIKAEGIKTKTTEIMKSSPADASIKKEIEQEPITKPPKPPKQIRKPEFAFESQVEEIDLSQEQILFKKEIDVKEFSDIIKNVTERLDTMENKLNGLVEDFKEFKNLLKDKLKSS